MNKRIRLLVPILLFALLLSACGGDDDGEEVSMDPEEIYKNCIACHGTDREGRNGPSLQNIGGKYTAEEIVDIIQNGKGGMVAITRVTEEQAEVLAEWLIEQ